MNKSFNWIIVGVLAMVVFGCTNPATDPTISAARSEEISAVIGKSSQQAMDAFSGTANAKAVDFDFTETYENPDGAGTITISISDFSLVSDQDDGFNSAFKYKLVYDGFEVVSEGISYFLSGTIYLAATMDIGGTSPVMTIHYEIIETSDDFSIVSGAYSALFDIDLKYVMDLSVNLETNVTTATYSTVGTFGNFTVNDQGTWTE